MNNYKMSIETYVHCSSIEMLLCNAISKELVISYRCDMPEEKNNNGEHQITSDTYSRTVNTEPQIEDELQNTQNTSSSTHVMKHDSIRLRKQP